MKWICLLLALAGVLPGDALTAEAPAVELVQTIPMPELSGGTNHLAIDVKRGRFFVTAPGDKKLVVVDLKAGKVLRVISGMSPAAARFIPDLDQLCVSGGGSVRLLDGNSLVVAATVEIGSPVDELQYDPKAKRLYAGITDAAKPAVAVIDVPGRKLLDRIKLPAKPQGFVLDQKGSRLYVNTPAAKQVTVIDCKKQAIAESWPLAEAQGNYPAALDEVNHRLFIGCRRPPKLLVLDTTSGKIVASADCGADTDDMGYDPKAGHIYLACGAGMISVIGQADHYQQLGDVPTRDGARNALFVPELKRLYVAVPGSGASAAELRVYEDGGS